MSIFVVLESCQGLQLPVAIRESRKAAVDRAKDLAILRSERPSQVELLSSDGESYGARCVPEEVVFTVTEVEDCGD